MKKGNVKPKTAKIIFLFVISLCLAGDAFSQNLEALTEQINRGNSEQKRSALAVIRNLESPQASRVAVPALRDSDIIVRATAAFSVIYLPEDEALQVLLPLLQDRAELVRREAAYALGRVGNPAAVNPLLQIIQRDKIFEVRGAAVVALGQIGDVSAVDALTQILRRRPQEREEFIRRSAAKSIGQIAQILQYGYFEVNTPKGFLNEKNKNLENPQYPNLIEAFPVFLNANDVLIQTLQNPREFQDVKREAAFALGAVGSKSSLPVLQSSLNNSDYYLAEISKESIRKILLKNPE